jgi:hypothetical protein
VHECYVIILELSEIKFGDVPQQSFDSTILSRPSSIAPLPERCGGLFPENCSTLGTVSPFAVRFLNVMAFRGGSYGHIEAGAANIVWYSLSHAFNIWNCLSSLRMSRQLRYWTARSHNTGLRLSARLLVTH